MFNKVRLLVLFCFIFFSQTSAYAGFQGSVSQTLIPEGQSFQLYLRQDKNGTDPDLSILEKDFTILRKSRGFKSTNINGVVDSFYEINLTLSPNKTGKVTLPSIQAGNEKTAPILLTVTPANENSSQSSLFAKASISNNKPFVESEFVYTVSLYATMAIQDGAISPPVSDKFTLEPFAKPKQYQETLDDQSYMVTEYKFLVFPKEAGKQTLPPTRFNVVVEDQNSKPDINDMFGGVRFQGRSALLGFTGSKTLLIQTKSIPVDVQQKPTSITENWLPAVKVEISENRSPDTKEAFVGDAITRTVTVTASGARDSLIPDLVFNSAHDFKQYPSKTEAKNLINDSGLIGIKTRQVVFMPTKAGELVLPEMQIPWYDIVTKTNKIAVLPSQKIQVALPQGVQAQEKEKQISVGDSAKEESQQGLDSKSFSTNGAKESTPTWLEQNLKENPKTVLTTAVLLGVLIFSVLWLFWLLISRKKRKQIKETTQKTTLLTKSKATRLFMQACLENSPVRTQKTLIALGSIYWSSNPPLTLTDVCDRFKDKELLAQVELLNQAIYAPQEHTWQGESLWEAFQKTSQYHTLKKQIKQELIPPLYPKESYGNRK